jgi:hypothetical protein
MKAIDIIELVLLILMVISSGIAVILICRDKPPKL